MDQNLKPRRERFVLGIMKTAVAEEIPHRLNEILEPAATRLESTLVDALDLEIKIIEFTGPRLADVAGTYSALDFLRVGLTEKLERAVDFLLIVTELDLAASTQSYALAMPSQLMNIGVVSTRRLPPDFWGDPPDKDRTIHRLTTLLLHTFGHLLNLPHLPDTENMMYDFETIEDLDRMQAFTPDQIQTMRYHLPREARERTARRHIWWFILKQVVRDWPSIARAVVTANPFRLLTRLTTAITTGLSVAIVLFFTAEIWDVAGTVELYQLVVLGILAIVVATVMLYRAFAFGAILSRHRTISESTVVTEAATVASIVLTMLLLFLIFFGLWYLSAVTIFPRKLMVTWPTTDPAVKTLDHIKLSLFVSSMSVLAGSLGGRADSQSIIRGILFLDEET